MITLPLKEDSRLCHKPKECDHYLQPYSYVAQSILQGNQQPANRFNMLAKLLL